MEACPVASVLRGSSRVYIYPGAQAASDAHVSSLVRAADADLDAALYRVVARWLDDSWAFRRVEYAVRPE